MKRYIIERKLVITPVAVNRVHSPVRQSFVAVYANVFFSHTISPIILKMKYVIKVSLTCWLCNLH